MANYFSYLPNFDYVNRIPSDQSISSYTEVKNLFKRVKLNSDLFQNLTNFTKYQIVGDERPDNVAKKIYGNSELDWLVLVSNNIINIQTEWPMRQNDFDEHLLLKYGSYQTLYSGIHHYESKEIKDSNGVVILPEGLIVDEGYEFLYTNPQGILERRRPGLPITNYDYELKMEDGKRNINILKPKYVNLVIDDLKGIMQYEKGSTQYVSRTLKRADNAKLYS